MASEFVGLNIEIHACLRVLMRIVSSQKLYVPKADGNAIELYSAGSASDVNFDKN